MHAFFQEVPPHLVLDDFQQSDICCAEIVRIHDQRAVGAATGIELAHSAGNQVYQNVGVTNLFQCFFTKFSVQKYSDSLIGSGRIVINRVNAIEKCPNPFLRRCPGFSKSSVCHPK